jgi:hypothetical protein
VSKCIAVTVFVLLVLGGWGCKEDPKEAYERLVFHAKTGNQETFIDGFTKRSRPLIKTLIALRRTYNDQVSESADPYLSLVRENVIDVKVTDAKEKRVCEGQGNEIRKAVLTIANGNKNSRQIVMYECDDGWKVDAFNLQDFWQDDPTRLNSR